MSFAIRQTYKARGLALSTSFPSFSTQKFSSIENMTMLEKELSSISFDDEKLTKETSSSEPTKTLRQHPLMSMARNVPMRQHSLSGHGGIRKTHYGIADAF